ncbi:MAG: ATP-binding protein [Lachnospirales bacterium]
MKSIKIKLVLVFIVVVFLAMMVSSTFIVLKYRNDQATREEIALVAGVRKIEEQIIYTYESEYFQEGFNDIFKDDFYNSQMEAAILSGDGFSVYATTDVISNLSVPTVIAAINGQESFEAWREDLASSDIVKQWFEYSKPIFDDGGEVSYIIYARIDATDSVEALDSMVQTLAIALIIALTLTAMMSVLLSKTVTDPIIDLKNKAELLARGDLDQKAIIESHDEIGQLGESFNYMARELKRFLLTISYEKNKVEVVLNNMQDGVIAFDDNNKLLHANPVAIDMLDSQYISYEEVRIVLENNSIDIANTYNDLEKIILYDDKYLKTSISKFGNSESNIGTIILLQDVTKSQKLDEIRKDFVANVSHEIRTPLTTIKTYAETLRSGAMLDVEVADSFLKIIESETDRMSSLAEDLLQLSKLDNGKLTLNFEKVELYSVLRRCILQTEVMAIKTNQEIELIEGANAYVYADVVRINQVFNNIITNAIKYNKTDGHVRIYIEERSNAYDIIVEDTGIGIDKKDLDRIFERFYRVDKARSRVMGGTGLGLSIARQIVYAHEGNIRAYSEPNIGTKMVVTLEKYEIGNNTRNENFSLLE